MEVASHYFTFTHGDPYNFPWHLVSLPIFPSALDVLQVYAPNLVDGFLHRYDPAALSYITFTIFDEEYYGPPMPTWGNWFQVIDPGGETISYTGVRTDFPVRTLLSPQFVGGWHIIGFSILTPIQLADCSAYNPAIGESCDMATAVARGWIGLPLWGYSNPEGRYTTVDLDGPPFSDTTEIEPWMGYWVNSMATNIVLITPRPSGPTP